jgi:predicted Zn-ribbon and HTH transcriptional regulator
MIDAYCRNCGLHISVPDEFSGGKGKCPRCLAGVRIPRPIEKTRPEYTPGLRYITEDPTKAARETPAIVSSEDGANVLYRCTGCSQQFQSLQVRDEFSSICPNCKKNGVVVNPDLKFPRLLSHEDHFKNLHDTIQAHIPEAAPADEDDEQGDTAYGVQGEYNEEEYNYEPHPIEDTVVMNSGESGQDEYSEEEQSSDSTDDYLDMLAQDDQKNQG